jgi:hypothetical protein
VNDPDVNWQGWAGLKFPFKQHVKRIAKADRRYKEDSHAPRPPRGSRDWPLLTLLKQARASGVGVVLATQNPVDLDYKGLANTGTWFLGRLQTERDKARVLDGLEGLAAAAGHPLDRRAMEQTLSGLASRVSS